MKKHLKINWRVVLTVLLAAILLVACGDPYSLQSVERFDEKVETFAPKHVLSAEQVITTLPAGIEWTTHIEGQTCKAFELNPSTKLPVNETPVSEGALFPAGTMFSISCPDGGRIYWTRTVVPPTPAPTEAPPAQ